jgi:hypothetical protein
MLSYCRNSLPVTARRKSGAPLAAYSTIPEGGHTTDTDRQPCKVKTPIFSLQTPVSPPIPLLHPDTIRPLDFSLVLKAVR